MASETELAAGRELDVLIATEVMGWTGFITEGDYIVSDDGDVYWFSTTYEGMGRVLERMRELGWEIGLGWGDLHADATMWTGDTRHRKEEDGFSDTLPHAVCLAALKAVRA